MLHTEYEESREAGEAIRGVLSGDEDELYFAVSRDFYELEDQEKYEQVYASYESYFAQLATKLTTTIGEPSYRGRCDDADYPDWAEGEAVAVWAHNDPPVYLRIYHEDRECPIMVVLSRIPNA